MRACAAVCLSVNSGCKVPSFGWLLLQACVLGEARQRRVPGIRRVCRPSGGFMTGCITSCVQLHVCESIQGLQNSPLNNNDTSSRSRSRTCWAMALFSCHRRVILSHFSWHPIPREARRKAAASGHKRVYIAVLGERGVCVCVFVCVLLCLFGMQRHNVLTGVVTTTSAPPMLRRSSSPESPVIF